MDASWLDVRNSSFDLVQNNTFFMNFTIECLRSATTYDFRFVANYQTKNTYLMEFEDKITELSELYYQQPQQAKTKGKLIFWFY